MKQKMMYWMLACFAAIAMLSSCSDAPSSAELIPDDAVAVVSIDGAGLYEVGGFEAEDTDDLLKLLDKSGLGKKTRNFLEEVVKDPALSGVDLEQPLMIFATETPNGGLVGSVSDADKLTEFINTLGKEMGDDFEKVDQLKKSGLNYSKLTRGAFIMFDDEKFVLSGGLGQDDDDIIDDMEGYFEQGAEKSIVSSEVFQKLAATEGQVKMMVQGEIIELLKQTDRDVRRALEAMNEIYGDLDFDEVSYIAAANIVNGEATLSYEVVPESDKMKEFIEKNAALAREIQGTHLAYVPEDVLFVAAANMNGEAILEQVLEVLKKSDEMDDIPAEVMSQIKKAVKSVDGEITFVLTDVPNDDMPEMQLYAATKDNTIVKMVNEETNGAFESTGKDAWKYTVEARQRYYLQFGEEPRLDEYVYTDYSTDEQYVYRNMKVGEVVWGFKDNTTYVASGVKATAFKKADKALSESNVKGKKFYACFHPEALLKMGIIKKEGIDKEKEFKDVKKVVDTFDFVEYYNEGDTKAVMRVVMKDKSQSPVKVLKEVITPIVKKYM